MKQSEKIDILTNALVDAQKATKGAEINAENPFYQSKYADLPAVCRASKGALSDNGLAISQGCDFDFNPVTGELVEFLVTMLSHISGQWIQTRQVIKPIKPGGQERGKEITYARRYSSLAIINNFATDDPDLDSEDIQGDDKLKKEAARKVGEKKFKSVMDKKKAKEQDDIPLGDVPISEDQAAQFRAKAYDLKLTPESVTSMLTAQEITDSNHIPSGRFKEMMDALEFMADEYKSKDK